MRHHGHLRQRGDFIVYLENGHLKRENRMSQISYGGRSSSSGPRIFLIFAATIAAITTTYYWGDIKASKMLAAYPDTPRTVKSAGPDYVSSLRAKLTRAQQKVNELTRDAPPADRQTKAEEKEQWEQGKFHLHKHVRKLNVMLKEKVDELAELAQKLKDKDEKLKKYLKGEELDAYSDEDRAGLDVLTEGGEV